VRARLVAAACVALLLVAGCGGGGGDRLSAAEYRAELAAIGKEAATAEAEVEKGLHAKTLGELRDRLDKFAAMEEHIADEVDALKAPKNAEAANHELAEGEHELAGELHAILPKVAKATSVKAALALVNHDAVAAAAGKKVDHALTELKGLGYAGRT
jgi:hypothetical protein